MHEQAGQSHCYPFGICVCIAFLSRFLDISNVCEGLEPILGENGGWCNNIYIKKTLPSLHSHA